MSFVKSKSQLANIFTIGVMSKVLHLIVYKSDIRDIHAPTRGRVLEYANI